MCARLLAKLPGSEGWAPGQYADSSPVLPLELPVGRWAAERFSTAAALVFIGAAGIAVRAVGPLAQSKGSDPAVVCVDEEGRFVIPLLSGHIGGANALARRIAALTGGTAVITTATDVQHRFSPDDWAARSGCVIPEPGQIKAVSSALLEGETVGFCSDFPVEGELPQGVKVTRAARCGILISLTGDKPFAHTLWIVPKCLRLGIGCRKGVAPEAVETAVIEVLRRHKLPLAAVAEIATITLKVQEPALVGFCSRHKLPLRAYTGQQLSQVEGSRASSVFVQQVTGVDNVCERAALAEGGELLVEKTADNSVTIAVAKTNWRAVFCSW